MKSPKEIQCSLRRSRDNRMNKERASKVASGGKTESKAKTRKAALSPELKEVLNMLKSLETELEPGKQTVR